MDLVAPNRALAKEALIQLFLWYENEELPKISNTLGWREKFGTVQNPAAVTPPTKDSRSTLCHASVSQWCLATKTAENHANRSERCGKVTAESAYMAAKLLCRMNRDGAVPTLYSPDPLAATCKTSNCHSANVRPGVVTNCFLCHK